MHLILFSNKRFHSPRGPQLRSAATKFICAAAFLASSAIAAEPSWVQLSTSTAPPPRSYLSMAYDAVSRKIILFGGFDGTTYLNDTWTFDGTTWTQITRLHLPPARANAGMAYDAATQKVVLYGGYNGRSYLGDTWLWDGATSRWTRARPAHSPPITRQITTQRPAADSPPAVTGPVTFTDPNGSVDVFGGFDGHLYQAGIWQWTGSDWNQLFLPTVPYGRSSAPVALDPVASQVVLFGGLADINPVNTWTYNGTTWTMRSPTNQPLWVYAASAAFDAPLASVVLFGGGSGGVDQNTTWQWTRSNWKQILTSQSPPAREGAGMVYDEALGHAVLFGGQDATSVMNDTWELLP